MGPADDEVLLGKFDACTPNPARMYNYMLGGKDNYGADRRAVDRLLEHSPDARNLAMDNRGVPPAGRDFPRG